MTPIRIPLLLLIGLAACRTGSGPTDDLADARARWAATEPGSYTIRQQVTCFCLPDVTRPVEMTVGADGQVASVVYADSGTAVPGNFRQTFRTVEGLFGEIAAALAAGAAEVRVTYDPDIGLPTDLYIDRDRQLADEEIGWHTVLIQVSPLNNANRSE